MTDDRNDAESAAKLDMWWRGLSDGQRTELLTRGDAPEWTERSLRSGHIDASTVEAFLDSKRSDTP